MLAEYETWQKERQLLPTLHPFDYSCHPVCKPSPSVSYERWLEFREDFLARKYEFLCFSVHFAWNTWGTHSKEPACLLHFGEFFATTDVLNGNLFFYLARSSVVDHVVMDSNMALVGAPSSPNIVSILVSVAKAYKKKVHYEAATERVLPCNDLGQLLETGAQTDVVAMHLLQEGLKNSIKFGADSIGITNLCSPHAALPLLDSTRPAPTSGHPRRSPAYTALIYGVFYSWSKVVSGATCGTRPTPCWNQTCAQLPRFGESALAPAGTCGMDVAQRPLLQLWDNLSKDHPYIQVVGDASVLGDAMLMPVSKQILLRYECVMGNTWDFPGGSRQLSWFTLARERFDFEEVVVSEELCDRHTKV